MKKLSALFLALCLLLSFAIAEDVPSMTDAELKELYVAVKEELTARKLWDAAVLPAGVYDVSSGLPEGNYVVKAKNYTIVSVFSSCQAYLNDEPIIDYYLLDVDQQMTMQLRGDLCYKFTKEVTIMPYTGFIW